jgi:DNA-binding XRE family transcriptional regulator
MLKTTKARTRVRKNNVIPFATLSTRARSACLPPGMHDEQIVRGQLLAFPTNRRHDVRPRLVRDHVPLAPLLDALDGMAGVTRHFGEGVPAAEDVSESLHMTHLNTRDGLSRQVVAIVPVTDSRAHLTIQGMGRARTPVQFNKELAMRLKAARIAAGYDTQPQFAKDLGIELERYKKWESGRTPIQHEYLTQVCELTGKDPNYFYGVTAREAAIKRTGS